MNLRMKRWSCQNAWCIGGSGNSIGNILKFTFYNNELKTVSLALYALLGLFFHTLNCKHLAAHKPKIYVTITEEEITDL
ncbi:hypothetical protein B9T62_19765 [Paenibacillus donghaensis]|uniref:Uncharacterized protein n=1 Tax=Paenibacillus donghaensis TaxID=414771 RepID=A0A2Z2KI22_9BACL|nr:hypothetical protein B9T62_19765 [Paenibacillus donghaensis]